MFNRIRAVHIVVNSVEEAAKDYADRFGVETSRSEDLPDMGVKNAILQVGDAVLELIEPLEPGQGPVSRFLQTRGEGVYMMAIEVDNLDETVVALRAKGVRMIADDAESRAKGGPVFVHPKSTHGVLLELVQKA